MHLVQARNRREFLILTLSSFYVFRHMGFETLNLRLCEFELRELIALPLDVDARLPSGPPGTSL